MIELYLFPIRVKCNGNDKINFPLQNPEYADREDDDDDDEVAKKNVFGRLRVRITFRNSVGELQVYRGTESIFYTENFSFHANL